MSDEIDVVGDLKFIAQALRDARGDIRELYNDDCKTLGILADRCDKLVEHLERKRVMN